MPKIKSKNKKLTKKSSAKGLEKAIQLHKDGALLEARQAYLQLLNQDAKNTQVLSLIGLLCIQQHDFVQAEKYLQKINSLGKADAKVLLNLGVALQNQGKQQDALNTYQQVIKKDQSLALAHFNCGTLYEELAQIERAVEAYQTTLQLDPNHADAHNNLGNCYKQQSQYATAIEQFQKALSLQPQFPTALNNLGVALKSGTNAIEEAIACYQQALGFDPNYADCWSNLGNALLEKKAYPEAILAYQQALNIKPNAADVFFNLGCVYQQQNKLGESVQQFERCLQLEPQHGQALAYACHQYRYLCDWQQVDKYQAQIDNANYADNILPFESPFMHIAHCDDEQHNFNVAKAWSEHLKKQMAGFKKEVDFSSWNNKSKITIGYLSCDFHDHATLQLMRGMLMAHDHDQFNINLYSYGIDDQSVIRKEIADHVGLFTDISAQTYIEACQTIQDDRVDILVDLKGYTEGHRLPICALRAAPIQVSYLGYPGTTGADFMDYIITDDVVTPNTQQPYYSEQFLKLPNTYQCNDNQQAIATSAPSRQSQNLPEQSFIFCSFNQSYKLDKTMFSAWLEILKAVPNSVLWLLAGDPLYQQNILQFAGQAIDPKRIIFADKQPKAQHLARLQLADLMLDTRLYNGHTTTSDALWAGVPTLTLTGQHFASRVSTSLLTAFGLPELITTSIHDFQKLGIELAKNTNYYQQIREKVKTQRDTCALFNTKQFTKDIEALYRQIRNKYYNKA